MFAVSRDMLHVKLHQIGSLWESHGKTNGSRWVSNVFNVNMTFLFCHGYQPSWCHKVGQTLPEWLSLHGHRGRSVGLWSPQSHKVNQSFYLCLSSFCISNGTNFSVLGFQSVSGLGIVCVGKKQLAVRATVNILDWKLVLKMELSVGCLQQPTAVTLTRKPAAGEHGHTHWSKPSDFNVQIVEVQLLLVPLSEEPLNVHSLGQQLVRFGMENFIYISHPGFIYLFIFNIYFKDICLRHLISTKKTFYKQKYILSLPKCDYFKSCVTACVIWCW